MASADENLTGLKQTMTSNNAVYATIKTQYVGSWRDDIENIGNMVGRTPEQIKQLNPWLEQNNFKANDYDYVTLLLKQGATGGKGTNSNAVNDIPTGYYATNSWVFPLGVGTWKCSQGFKQTHAGLDLVKSIRGAISGSPIYASKAGTVVQAYTSSSWGNTILIRHDDTKDASGNCYFTRYAHMLAAPKVAVGDKVSQGDKIGNVGNTGTSTGAHLHFQIYFTDASRTDYTNFDGGKTSYSFSVDPNNIPDFPGNPWKEGQSSQVDYVKSEYVTEQDINVVKRLVEGDEAEIPVTKSEFDATVNGISDRIIQGKNITNSDVQNIVRQYVEAQLSGVQSSGSEALYQLLNGGDFYTVFNNFVQSVVNNSINYMYTKVGEAVVTAGQTAVNQAKAGLKDYIFTSADIDPNSELASSLGNYLDGYVDRVVQNGWQSVTIAINTGDVEQACQIFLTNTKRDSIDFLANVTMHGCATAITSYIESNVKDPVAAQVAADLGVGIVNVVVQSIGGVLKGDISIGQAAKNILSQAVVLVTKTVVQGYFKPIITDFLTNAIRDGIVQLCADAGITIGGNLLPGLGHLIGALVGYVVGLILDLIVDKLVGLFTN